MIFWFAGFIALGAELPPPRYCHYSTCRALQAVTVFGAFEWWALPRRLKLRLGEVFFWWGVLLICVGRVLFSVTTYFAIMDLFKHRNTGDSAQKTQHNAHLGVWFGQWGNMSVCLRSLSESDCSVLRYPAMVIPSSYRVQSTTPTLYSVLFYGCYCLCGSTHYAYLISYEYSIPLWRWWITLIIFLFILLH